MYFGLRTPCRAGGAVLALLPNTFSGGEDPSRRDESRRRQAEKCPRHVLRLRRGQVLRPVVQRKDTVGRPISHYATADLMDYLGLRSVALSTKARKTAVQVARRLAVRR